MQKKIYKYKRFWLLVLVLLYLIFGFFIAPKIIQEQIKTQVNTHLSMQANMTDVAFNPLTFTTAIDDLALTDRNNETWYQSAKTSINFDPFNLIIGQWKFSDLNLVQPKITLLTDGDGQVLIPALPEFSQNSTEEEPINLAIEQITLAQGQMNLQANNIKQNFSLGLKRIEIEHDQFNVADIDTHYKITITTENDELIVLDGSYNHPQQIIKSSINLNNWQAQTINKFLPDALMINNQAGMIQAMGSIDWQLSQKPLLNFSKIEIQDLKTQWQETVLVERLLATINQVSINTEDQVVSIEHIESPNADWQIYWPMNGVTEGTEAEDEVETEASVWMVNIDSVHLENWPVNLIDNSIQAELPINIDQLTLNKVNNNNQPFTVNTMITVNNAGTVEINSEQQIAPLNLDATLNMTGLSLADLSPWITAISGLVFTQGTISSEQDISLSDQEFDLVGDLKIVSANIQNQSGQAIADWGQLNIAATSISSENKTVIIDQITLDQANGNIIIDANKNINIQNLKSNDSDVTDTDSTSSDWVIKIGAVNIKDTSTALIDESIQPSVKTSISELNGAIKGLSSESLSKADVDITGKFNQFSPLSIQGQINPLSSDAYTDLKVEIKDLDLLAFSAYSTQTVAFPINGGKLDVSLDYSLNQHELKGENNLLFKQFKLGNKTPSPEAVDLPLKLAVTLLTDMNGEMKIDLPVSGNINDPEFSYGGLVGKAIFKLITSIVASPFKILGALIPNPDPNLSDIQFTSGSAELSESEQNKLNQIAEIMAQKSSLSLQLNPHIDTDFDQKGLQLKLLLSKAPFEQFDVNNENVVDWLKVQLTPEELATHQAEDGTINHNSIWEALLNRQVVTENEHKELTAQRNLTIKNYLLETAGISAEKVFIEQAIKQPNNQSLVKIGVSQ